MDKKKTHVCVYLLSCHTSLDLLVIPSRVLNQPEDSQINIYFGAGAYGVQVRVSLSCSFVNNEIPRANSIFD